MRGALLGTSKTRNRTAMRFKLTYKIGLAIVQEWIFTSKGLAYWKKRDLIETGRFNDGKFLITPI